MRGHPWEVPTSRVVEVFGLDPQEVTAVTVSRDDDVITVEWTQRRPVTEAELEAFTALFEERTS